MWDMQDILGKFSQDNKARRSLVGRIDTLISAHVTIMGDIRFSGGVQIDGTVNGSLIAEDQGSTLRVTRAGRVCGDIKGPNIVINGNVEGDVYATERLELSADAVINGDVYYELIEMVMGAQVNGRLVHATTKTATPIELPRATESFQMQPMVKKVPDRAGAPERTTGSAGASAEINVDPGALVKKKSKVRLGPSSAKPATSESSRAC